MVRFRSFILKISISMISLLATGNIVGDTITLGINRGFAYYPKELEATLDNLIRLPEARQLLEKVNKQGPIGLVLDSRAESGAYWDSYHRKIGVNHTMLHTRGALINGILFELHNAVQDKMLNHYTTLAARGRISKEDYVEAIEKIEHENAVSASGLLKKGVEEKIYPEDASWTVFHEFADHYLVQQVTGHSNFIADRYDHLAKNRKKLPYKGTIPNAQDLSQEDKKVLMRLLSIKNDLKSENRDDIAKATAYLLREYQLIEKCAKESKNKECENYKHHLQLMELTLKGNPVFELIRQKTISQNLKEIGQKTKGIALALAC